MGVRKKAKRKLQFIDGEKRPPFGASDAQLDENKRVATLMNRIAELELTIAGYSRGDELAFLSPQARKRLTLLTRSGFYGSSDRETAAQLLNAALRLTRADLVKPSRRPLTSGRVRR
jgi:hypothetical protein